MKREQSVKATVQAAVDFWEKLEREAGDHASVILGARIFAEGDFREWQIIDGAGKDPKPSISHKVEVLQDLMNRADAGPTGTVLPDGWKSFLDKQLNSPSYRDIISNDKSGAVFGEIRGTWFDGRDELQQLGLFRLLATHCRKEARLARCGQAAEVYNSAESLGLSQSDSRVPTPSSETSPREFFDLNNPPKVPYEYREFPDTIYHHETRRNVVVHSAEERSACLTQGLAEGAISG